MQTKPAIRKSHSGASPIGPPLPNSTKSGITGQNKSNSRGFPACANQKLIPHPTTPSRTHRPSAMAADKRLVGGFPSANICSVGNCMVANVQSKWRAACGTSKRLKGAILTGMLDGYGATMAAPSANETLKASGPVKSSSFSETEIS